MRFRDDTRGVTVQVGAVLFFATIIIALALYQATVVPAQNADVEYQHSEAVEGDLTQLRNSILSAAADGNTRPTSVQLGTSYPSRVFLVNPPPPSGTLRTGAYADDTMQVSNVEATNNETRDYLSGSWSASTKYVEYVPDYSEYQSAPTRRFSASVLSNYFPDRNVSVPLTDQLLVRDDTITLVAINGSLATSRSGPVSVSPEALSAPTQRVQVTPQNPANPVTVTVPTSVSAGAFRNQTELGDQSDVTVADAGTNRVEIRLTGSGPYILQTARVGVGSDTNDPGPHYVTLVENDSDSATVEVRDRFNNPVSGVTVTASGEFATSNRLTDENGQATFEVADDVSGTGTLSILGGGSAQERVSVPVDTASSDSDAADGNVTYNGDAVAADGGDANSITGGVNFSVTNEYDQRATITDVTIEPADDTIDVLADRMAGEGVAASEVFVDGDVSDGLTDYSELTFSDGNDGTLLPRKADIDIDGRVNPGNPVVTGGSDARFYLYEFFRDADAATNVNMTGEPVNVTVRYRLDDQTVGETAFRVTPAAPGGGGGGGFSSTGTTSIVPNAGSQTQTIEFTVSSAMAASESVTVDLSDAQSASPLRVDYQSGSANVVSGPAPSNIGFASQSTTDAVVTYSPSSDLQAGDTVVLEVTGVKAGPQANQQNPYSVTVARSDAGSTTTQFSVAPDAGASNLQSVSVTDLGNDGSQPQTLSFTPATDLEGGERVAIDLSAAEAGNVDYGSAGVDAVSQGSASKNQNGDTVYVTYTAPSGGVSAGTQVDVTLSPVSASGSGTYEVGFSRARGGTTSATFSVSGGSQTDPSLQSSAVEDNSDTSGSNDNRQARYDVSYTVSDPDGRFDRVEVEFASSQDSSTETSTQLSDTLRYTGPPGTASNQASDYTITIRVYDVDGNVVDSRTVTDSPDGNNP